MDDNIVNLLVHSLYEKSIRIINRVYVHCSASSREDITANDILHWHLERGFTDIGYHFFIKTDGVIEKGRDIDLSPAAQKGYNIGTIAICLNGLHVDDFNDKQFDTLRRLCKMILKDFPKVTFHGHKEVSNKACPVFDYKKVLSLDDKGSMIV